MKRLLKRKVEKSYLLLVGVVSIFLIVGYFSYAYFTLQTEKANVISIKAGTLVSSLTSTDISFLDNKITVENGTTKEIVIKLSNTNSQDAKFNFYYIGNLASGVKVGYKSGTTVPPSTSGVVLQKSANQSYTIVIRNNSGSTQTITFGSDAGLSYNPLTFSSNGHIFEEFREENAPKLGEGMIPVIYNEEIKKWEKIEEGNRKWYDYKKKEWANAVILVDHPSKEYGVGEAIEESDIESYFVWIPRYQYRIFDAGNYDSGITVEPAPESIAKEIEIEFQGKEDEKAKGDTKGEWLTHPAFTLGGEELSGIWVGKFETGYNQSGDGSNPIDTSGWTREGAQVDGINSNKIIIKPNVYSWRSITVKNIFMNAYNYKRDLGSHMMKNIEWGAVAYLSHSKYGIGKEVNINNNSAHRTGYSAVVGTNQSDYPGERGTDPSVTLPYDDKETGYLASTTGNITGIYDMSGGAWEYMAAYMDGYGVQNSKGEKSGFTDDELNTTYVDYLDKYPKDSSVTSYKNRILGDATGEMGPFYNYLSAEGVIERHNAWYSNISKFVEQSYPWFRRSGVHFYGVLAGQFTFITYTGGLYSDIGSRLVLAP